MPPGTAIPEKTAPEPLELVQRFVNSVDLESGEDELGEPEALRAWLAERDLIGAGRARSAGRTCAARDRRARGPARAADGQQRAGGRRASGWSGSTARPARAGVRVASGRARSRGSRPRRAGVDGAIARLLAIVAGAVEQGQLGAA